MTLELSRILDTVFLRSKPRVGQRFLADFWKFKLIYLIFFFEKYILKAQFFHSCDFFKGKKSHYNKKKLTILTPFKTERVSSHVRQKPSLFSITYCYFSLQFGTVPMFPHPVTSKPFVRPVTSKPFVIAPFGTEGFTLSPEEEEIRRRRKERREQKRRLRGHRPDKRP